MLQGATYRKTASEYHVGLATLNRIVKDARRRAPDFDDLRQLSIILRKLDLTLFDVMKACPILGKLEELGVGVEELSSFVEGVRCFAKEQKIDAADLASAMSELVVLKTETGKSYKELVDDFKNKQVQIGDMTKRAGSLRVKKNRSWRLI